MWLKFLLVSALAIGAALAEAPLAKSGPYPAAGWRPKKPFFLPGEYLPPVESERQKRPDNYNVEITKERVDFAGQIQSTVPLAKFEPQTAYAPPSGPGDNNILQVQQLPQQQTPPYFNAPEPTPNKQQFFPGPQANQGPPQLHTKQQGRPQVAQPFGQRLQPKRRPQTEQQQFSGNKQQQPQQQFIRPVEQYAPPAQQYGAPAQQYGAPAQVDPRYPVEPRIFEKDQNEQKFATDNRNAIEALNAALDAYNRAQVESNSADANADDEGGDFFDEQSQKARAENQPDGDTGPNIVEGERFKQGQYYILGPDNVIQRVMFTTTQDDGEYRSNGFTAHLKYEPVGEVRDPVFRYNNQGQLVRVFK